MVLAIIETILQNKIGLDAKVIGRKEISRITERRRLACNLPDLPSYLQYLQTSTQELQELIEEVIVPETWFFRDKEPFTFLQRYVTSELLPSQSQRILRLLSVPSSTGEEPYSIAMTLLNAGLTPHQFCIDAVDISKKSLLKAQQGIFRTNSFRGNNLEFRQRYFIQKGDEYHLSDLVKGAVNFRHGNLLNFNFLIDKHPYDIIFCRNVLIYFDQVSRDKTIQNLERLLKNQGLLFVGHADTSQIIKNSHFVVVRHPLAFAYRKKDDNQDRFRDENYHKNQQSNHNQTLKYKLETKINDNKSWEILNPIKNQNFNQEIPSLQTARSLADRGQLTVAATLCETYLKQNSTSVEAYVLLGQIHQAQGLEAQAEKCFQKAIYLEPNHYEALMQLALITEHRGDMNKAALLRQRIERLLIIRNL
ncbi:MAG: CheR family methyltransferase [Nostocaceae cyanobacterium]|nr:CheR family methyltransferase [Nostocaceae cyanobacterium]